MNFFKKLFDKNEVLVAKNNSKECKDEQLFIDIKDDMYNIIRGIKDPEFDNSLEELKVVSIKDIIITRKSNNLIYIIILWTPTVEYCKFASHIGLSIKKKLEMELANYSDYKMSIFVKDDKHLDFKNLNKQLNDKERYAAAQENPDLMKFIDELIQLQQ